MKVGVAGLWHLGTVTAACLASAGHEVTAFDGSRGTIEELRGGRVPVAAPGLQELIVRVTSSGALRFSWNPADLADSEVVWLTYDTPVDEDGIADVAFVLQAAAELFPHLRDDSLLLISSQLPVGSTRLLEETFRRTRPDGGTAFAYSPENLRLGKAIEVFTRPDRVVVGLRNDGDKERIRRLLGPFTERIEWMAVESAEMTKHALNAFLATSVVFANELAALCERVGASGQEVERGLKSDVRIGPRAYLRPGAAYAGGTLARDVAFLIELGRARAVATPMVAAVRESNDVHKGWARRRLQEILGDVRGTTVAILGLTYKPGTDTLRGSGAVDTARWLRSSGASVAAYDPAVRTLPSGLADILELRDSLEGALDKADAALVATEWPEFRSLAPADLVRRMRSPVLLDPSRFLGPEFGDDARIRYVYVGKPA